MSERDTGSWRPRITVITAVRNGAPTLQETLDSVFTQTYSDVELVVIDGASRDGSKAILEQNASRIAYWESEPDRGVYHAWNKALDHATGDWICFLGADDRFATRTVLERLAGTLAHAWPATRVVYGEVEVIAPDGSIMARVGSPWAAARLEFERRMSIPHPAAFHHRELFEAHGRFDESFSIAGDYEFLLRELRRVDPVFIPGVVVQMGGSGLSNRSDMRIVRLREIQRARRMHGLTPRPEWRSASMIRARCAQAIRRVAGNRAERRATLAYRAIRKLAGGAHGPGRRE